MPCQICGNKCGYVCIIGAGGITKRCNHSWAGLIRVVQNRNDFCSLFSIYIIICTVAIDFIASILSWRHCHMFIDWSLVDFICECAVLVPSATSNDMIRMPIASWINLTTQTTITKYDFGAEKLYCNHFISCCRIWWHIGRDAMIFKVLRFSHQLLDAFFT